MSKAKAKTPVPPEEQAFLDAVAFVDDLIGQINSQKIAKKKGASQRLAIQMLSQLIPVLAEQVAALAEAVEPSAGISKLSLNTSE